MKDRNNFDVSLKNTILIFLKRKYLNIDLKRTIFVIITDLKKKILILSQRETS